MPPRFTYWTIIFGGQPTSFRAGTRDELVPTFKQIQARHPDAQLRYFARGKLWYSEEEASAALIRDRFEKRQRSRPPTAGGWKPRADSRKPGADSWKPRADSRQPEAGSWKPRADSRKPEAGSWKPRADSRKPGAGSWKPRADSRKPGAGSWKPRADSRQPEAGSWKPRPDSRKPGAGSREPTAGSREPTAGSRQPERRRADWRPGGQHKDPRARFSVPRDVKRRHLAKKFGWKKKKDDE
jgi:hypothetical protein